MKQNFLKKHIETVKESMSKLEEQLLYTEDLSVDAITVLSGQMQTLEGHLRFLVHVDSFVNPQKVQPVKNKLIVQ
jgi:hypothetical protein